MQLENELGVKLFERSGHSSVLTNDGMLLKRRAQEIVSLAEKAKNELTCEKELLGKGEVGSGEFMSFSLLADIISDFSLQNPNVHFHFNGGNADIIKERLESGGFDIGLFSEPADISKYEFIRLPQKEKWGIIVHIVFLVSNRSYVTPDDLTVLPLIMLRRRLVHQRYGRAWKRIRDRYVANHPLCEMCLKNISNANLHLMFDKIVIIKNLFKFTCKGV